MGRINAGSLCLVSILAACSQQLSREQIEIIDAVAFVTNNLADGMALNWASDEPVRALFKLRDCRTIKRFTWETLFE